ncbi:hypothetical protein MMC32_004600 [Xylographa parallela]|nr:hypothetical protein [Xylographa parallela]
MASRLRLAAAANTSAAPAAPTAPVAPALPVAPASTAAARPNRPFICDACGQGFTRRSSMALRHWPICRGRQANPGARWDSHPSCQASRYNYRIAPPAAPAAPAVPAAPLVATPLVAAALVAAPLVAAAPVAAAPVAAASVALVAAPLAAAAPLPAPPAARTRRPTQRAAPRPACHPTHRPRVLAPPTANFIGAGEDDTMSQGEGATAAYGPPRWSQYQYMHVANWAGKRF